MRDLDHSLVHQIRKLVDGANVHYVNTWLFCYETSEPGSTKREKYERILRKFIIEKSRMSAARLRGQTACLRSSLLYVESGWDLEVDKIA
jgi:hypothetical protein